MPAARAPQGILSRPVGRVIFTAFCERGMGLAFRLTRLQDRELNAHASTIRTSAEALAALVEQANESIRDALRLVQRGVDEHNVHVESAHEFIGTIADEWEDDFNDRSERWQEGDVGQQVQSLIDAYRNIDLGDVDDPKILDIELDPDPSSHADEIDALPRGKEDV